MCVYRYIQRNENFRLLQFRLLDVYVDNCRRAIVWRNANRKQQSSHHFGNAQIRRDAKRTNKSVNVESSEGFFN